MGIEVRPGSFNEGLPVVDDGGSARDVYVVIDVKVYKNIKDHKNAAPPMIRATNQGYLSGIHNTFNSAKKQILIELIDKEILP